jgi:hypothetical protein
MEGGLINGTEIRKENDELVKEYVPLLADLAHAKNISISEAIKESDISDDIKQKLLNYEYIF